MLDTISWAEGTAGADGYRTQFTGTTFNDLSRHPRQLRSSGDLSSDAAGRYQILSTTWDEVARELGLRNFSPASQDLAALRLIERRGVNLDDVARNGIRPDTFHNLAQEWASLPTRKTGTSYYGQGGKKIDELLNYASQRRSSAPVARPAGGQPQPRPAAPVTPPAATAAASSAPPRASASPIEAFLQSMISRTPAVPSLQRSTTAATPAAQPATSQRMAGSGIVNGLAGLFQMVAMGPSSLRSTFGSGSGGGFKLPDAPKIPSFDADPVTQARPPEGVAPSRDEQGQTAPRRSGRMVGIVELGKMIQGSGLRVREHPEFGGVGGHSPNSLHYSGRAVDLTDWQFKESERSWKPRKIWMEQQLQRVLANADVELFGPHSDPRGHGTHIHLGLRSGSIPEELAQQVVAVRQQALQKYPPRWAG